MPYGDMCAFENIYQSESFLSFRNMGDGPQV